MADPDIRWKQRFGNFNKALAHLNEADALSRKRALSRLEAQGLIKGFEFTYELAWNTLKDFLVFQGNADFMGSRDTLRAAFKHQLITDDQGWMLMVADRNRSSHMYDEATADEIVARIHRRYLALFADLSAVLETHLADE
jgi:nucleotidyltransferase substrate binding protein (TIGR01987 family)